MRPQVIRGLVQLVPSEPQADRIIAFARAVPLANLRIPIPGMSVKHKVPVLMVGGYKICPSMSFIYPIRAWTSFVENAGVLFKDLYLEFRCHATEEMKNMERINTSSISRPCICHLVCFSGKGRRSQSIQSKLS